MANVRTCIKEEFEDYAAVGSPGMFRIKKWTFHYSDGAKETVKIRYKKL